MSVILGVVKQHIRGTEKKAPVIQITILVCNITNKVKIALEFPTVRIYITTKVLKHMYDKRTAQEFDFITENLPKIIKTPDKIYMNIRGKTGDYCFLKTFNNDFYFCILETKSEKNPDDGEVGMNYIVSTYKLNEDEEKRNRYLESYKLLWSWEGDNPPS